MKRQSLIITFLIGVLVLLAPTQNTLAQTQPPTLTGDLSDPADVATFFEGLMAGQLAGFNAPGATVAVVYQGEVVLVGGYGYANLENRTPVDGESTLFRPGSVSKVFAGVAVMQLVEQGLLDLDADINTYLPADLQFSPPGTQPVTLRHLLTHTAGFEDINDGLFVKDPEDALTLAETVRRVQPNFIYAPGEYSGYSNYSISLAGYLVEVISGQTFPDYVAEHIFEPLNMQNSSFEQPLPADLADQMATGYIFKAGRNLPRWFEIINDSPAGGLSATSADMARFMLALLNDGEGENGSIIQPDSLAEMWAPQFVPHPDSAGHGLVFFRGRQNGLQIYSHGGDTIYFHSALYVMPEVDAGLYVSYNGDMGTEPRNHVLTAFMERYFPVEISALPAPAADPASLAEYTGMYQLTRRNESGPEKVAGLFMSMSIGATDDGYLTFPLMGGTFAPAGPDKFVNIEQPEQFLLFERNSAGEVATVFVSDFVPFTGVRFEWYADPNLHMLILGVGLLMFVSTLIAAPVSFFVDRRIKLEVPRTGRVARWIGIGLCVANLATVAGLIYAFSDFEQLVFGFPDWFAVLYQLPRIAAFLTLFMVVLAVLSWMRGWWGWLGRLHYSLLTIIAVLYLAVLWYWNVLLV